MSSVSFLIDIFSGIDLKLRLEKCMVGLLSFSPGLHLFRSQPECGRVGKVQDEKEKHHAPWIRTHTHTGSVSPCTHALGPLQLKTRIMLLVLAGYPDI